MLALMTKVYEKLAVVNIKVLNLHGYLLTAILNVGIIRDN